MNKPTQLFLKLIPILLVCMLSSCDPARVLIMKPSKKQNRKILIYGNQALVPLIFQNDTLNKKVVIDTPIKDSNRNKELVFYGIGVWGDSSIVKFSKNIDSIVIIKDDLKNKLDSQEEINSYLKENLKGLLHNKIVLNSNKITISAL
jgi:hypothetical protein